jgi:hypothetical protein
MRFLVLVSIALAACAPRADSGPEDAVLEIYEQVQENVGQRVTPLDAIPMTEDLRSLVERAQAAAAARDEPFIDGDLAADCQDCASIADIVIGAQTGPEQIPAAEGHRLVEARFTLNGDEPRSILYDMVETPEGWRVDNMISHGFDLRAEAAAYLEETAAAESTPAAP